MISLWRAIGFAAIVLPVSAQNNVDLTPGAKAFNARGLSQIISPAFAGMGIEPSNLFFFTGGDDDINHLTIQLLNNLSNFTGVAPHLRIGGNSADNFIYDPSFEDMYIQRNPHTTGQGNYPSDLYIIGPGYFEAIDRFPSSTPITFGLNLAYDSDDWPDKLSAMADAALNGLKNAQLFSFEIGNEPDLYGTNGFRSSDWSGETYVRQWRDRAQTIYDRVLKPNNNASTFFEPGVTAATIGNSFLISDLAENGILDPGNDTGNKSFATAWNQHDYFYYIGVTGYGLTLDTLTDLSQTVAQFAAWRTQVQEAFQTGYRYFLREMASVGPAGMEDVSDVFGATLWTLNFFLYAATLNISSVQMHMTQDSWASPWQPARINDTEPHVRTTYYAFAATAQIIGGSCTTQIAALPIDTFPENYSNRLAAYAIYQLGSLHSVVMLNTRMSNSSETNKENATFTLNVPSYLNQTVFYAFLTAPGADSKEDTTWNGISYEVNTDGSPSTYDSTIYGDTVLADGTLTVNVRDSSAVVATFGQQLGTSDSEKYNATACSILAQVQPDASMTPSPAPLLPLHPSSTHVLPPSSTSTSSSSSPSSSSSSSGSDVNPGAEAVLSTEAPPAAGSGDNRSSFAPSLQAGLVNTGLLLLCCTLGAVLITY